MEELPQGPYTVTKALHDPERRSNIWLRTHF